MKKITFIKQFTFFITLFCVVNFGFGQEIASFSSLQNAACSGVVSNDSNISATGICRGLGVNETIVGSPITYNSRDWTTTAFLDSSDYLEWTLTPNAGHQMNLTTMDLRYDRSPSGGPTMLDIQVDAGSGFTSIFTDTFVSASSENNDNIDLTAYTNITETITFRLYAYNASALGGTFDIEERIAGTNKGIVINGVVTAIPCVGLPITWNGTMWLPVPPILTSPVIINDDYDTAINGSFSACSLIVNTGFTLRVTDGEFVQIINDVNVEGNIIVETQGNFVQNNNASSTNIISGGSVVVSKSKTVQKWYNYTYWSSPTESENIETALGFTPIDRRFTFNAANYEDLLAEIDNTNIFTSGQDGFDDDNNDWVNTQTGAMIPGVGYAATANEIGPAFPRTETFDFYGAFNNGEVLVPLISKSGGVYENWNLVGNPYPGAISADQFFSVNNGLVDIIYLWDQGTPPSSISSGNQNSNFSADDYAIINGTGEIGARGDTGSPPNRYVPSGQGFFVDANMTGDLIFNNSMRSITHDNSQFFKSSTIKNKTNNIVNKLWVNLKSDNGVYNQIMVGYVDGATNENDGAFYDAPRGYASLNNTYLYSVIESDNKKFAIQGKAINSITIDEIIKLGFKSTISAPTLYTVSIAQLQGNFLTENTVYLKDNQLNKVHNLSASDYTFTTEVGEFNSRFEIVFNDNALSTDSIVSNETNLSIIELYDDAVQFNVSDNLNITSVAIFDLLGRQLYNFKGQDSSEIYKLYNVSNMVYIAKVTLSNGVVITKKAVKK